MDVTAWLLRLTPPRPLVVTGLGGTEVRLAAERAIRERGWRPAVNPAEANILLVAGDGLDAHVERVWRSMPAPRARLTISAAADVPRQLDSAVAELRDTDRQRAHATPVHHPPEHDEHDTHHHADDGAHEHHPPEHDASDHHNAHDAQHGHDQHDQHANHGEHGHHMGGMDMPGGIPMADRAEDRDGLMLDVLHVPLGPVLPLWPPGLIVHTRLQGDVIQEASVEIVGSASGSFWSEPHRHMARRLDSSARLLALAGWTDAAAVAGRLRDEALDGAPSPALLRRWTGRVRHSRTLRWLLAGDVLARLDSWLDFTPPEGPQETQRIVDSLPAMLAGAELATARLIVASLDPDLELLAHHDTHHGTHHG